MLPYMTASAASGPPVTGTSVDNNPYVKWSPDYKAWTLGDSYTGPYEDHLHIWPGPDLDIESTGAYVIYTGMVGTKPVAPVGYHIYKRKVLQGESIPISKWYCSYSPSNCIQSGLRDPATGKFDVLGVTWHGMTNSAYKCLRRHHNGWLAFCANCGEMVNVLMYASDPAISSLKSIPVAYGLFYVCPYTATYDAAGHPTGGHFEQATAISHKCDAISANRYTVAYDPNYPPSPVPGYVGSGYTASTMHSYDDNMWYDGVKGQYATALRKNGYAFYGYKFTGWNTKPDGTGKKYADGQAVRNLTAVDNGTVRLYAQWAPCGSTLRIDPNGGKFDGSTAVQSFPGIAGSTFLADPSRVTPPAGVRISFQTNGGSACSAVTDTQRFVSWQSGPLYGTLSSGNVYTYPKADSVTDSLTAVYAHNAITLPTTSWANHSFGGWYFDAAFTKPAGSPGDKIVVTKDTIIYAQWAELVLTSVDDYGVYGGAGAVDLSWSQKDNVSKTYKLWQSGNGMSWIQLYSATDTSMSPISVTSGKTPGKTYTVTASGIYDIKVCGAQGANHGGNTGGKGGQVDVTMYLKKGDKVKYIVGGCDGSNGGGSGSMGNGGGWSAVYVNGSIVAIAGGGGGANIGYDGGAGGLTANTDTSTNTGKEPTDGKGSGGGGGYGAGAAGDYIPEVKSKKVDPLELTPGQIYSFNVDYHDVYGHLHRVGYYSRYVVDPDTYEVLHERPSDHHAGDYGSNDHVMLNGKTYYMFKPSNGSDPASQQYFKITNDYQDIGSIEKLMYCGYDNPSASPGAFGYKYRWDASDSITATWHGVDSPWHSNGHIWICGAAYEYVKVPASTSPSYGGSSHVYENANVSSSTMTPGAKAGDGSFSLKSVALGFQDDMYLNDVKAHDMARPDRIDMNTTTSTPFGTSVKLAWEEPASNGTTYWHKAQSFQAGSDAVLCESNVTENTLTSRITGYLYRIDTNPYGELSASDTKQMARSMTIAVRDYDQWLHLAAVDAAGNIAPAVHVRISKTPGPGALPVRWNLHTDQISITGTDGNVHHAHDKTYYVRADCQTPFMISGDGTLEGRPYAGYALNGYGFVSDSGSKNGGTWLEVSGASDGPAASIDQWSDAVTVLDPYPGYSAEYSGGRTILSGNSSFTMADGYDGVSIEVWPRAYAKYMEDLHELTKWSDGAADRNNGLILIGDARPPVIHGLDVLEGIDIIDREEDTVVLDIWCEDSGSGVGGFTVTVTNTDTGEARTYEKGDEHLLVNLTDDDPIFIGNFTVTVDARDNVGNGSHASANTDGFELMAYITRILSPHDPNFREGESGILHVRTLGFADRIEVSFPDGLDSYTQVIDYDGMREYEKNDEIQFMIPLYYLRDFYGGADHASDVPLIVKAYKGDMELTATPKMSVFNMAGTVLEEFRDRIR